MLLFYFIFSWVIILYSCLIKDSGVFDLLVKYENVKLAFEQSSKSRSTFYQYSQFLPLRSLIESTQLTKRECLIALDAYKSLLKSTDQNILSFAVQKTPFSPLYKADLIDFVNVKQGYKSQINDVLARNYDCVAYNDCYLPVNKKASAEPSADIKLLSVAVWSVAIATQEKLDKVINFSSLDTNNLSFLKDVKSRFTLLQFLIKRLAAGLPDPACYQSTELLITTNTKYRLQVIDLLKGGWG
jgi:hypothetical protein